MKLRDIDGTIDEVSLRRPARQRRAAQYDLVDIIDPAGVTTTLRNIRAQPAVAQHISVGSAGRYYLYHVAGFRGFHGFRPVIGQPVFDFPRNPARACLAIVLVNAAWIAWRANDGGGIPIIALAPFILACLFYAALRRAATDAQALVEKDRRPVIIPGQPLSPAQAATDPGTGSPG